MSSFAIKTSRAIHSTRQFFARVLFFHRRSTSPRSLRKSSSMGFAKNKRGALIVLEGCDRSGKSTQSKRLYNRLVEDGRSCCLLSFPDRSTPIGQLIDRYLQKKITMDDRAIHQLFSANRWELEHEIRKKIEDGITVLIDRYAYSGVAFSAAKKGMDLEWCKQGDVGLPEPDLVLFLNVNPEDLAKRGGFGDEIYENLEMQQKVYNNYLKLKESNWTMINADESVEKVNDELLDLVRKSMETVKGKKISLLWTQQ